VQPATLQGRSNRVYPGLRPENLINKAADEFAGEIEDVLRYQAES
jgi:hypothetical protein